MSISKNAGLVGRPGIMAMVPAQQLFYRKPYLRFNSPAKWAEELCPGLLLIYDHRFGRTCDGVRKLLVGWLRTHERDQKARPNAGAHLQKGQRSVTGRTGSTASAGGWVRHLSYVQREAGGGALLLGVPAERVLRLCHAHRQVAKAHPVVALDVLLGLLRVLHPARAVHPLCDDADFLLRNPAGSSGSQGAVLWTLTPRLRSRSP